MSEPLPTSVSPTTTAPGSGAAAGPTSCPSCGAEVATAGGFCESCGAPLSPTEQVAVPAPAGGESPVELSRAILPDADAPAGGTKPRSPRDHYVEQPATWVAACCDKGLRHDRNEDATAVAADEPPGSRAVLVVCDGVSTSTDSDVAALAGARAARDVLVGSWPRGLGNRATRTTALAEAFSSATGQANAAVVANTAVDSANAASCTFAAALVEGDLLGYANVGDSRVYWLPDAGPAAELSLDDSVSQVRIAMGVPRDEAEHGRQAHAITKWLGRDSPDVSPRTGHLELTEPGWVLVCSDGLWNYASAAADLQALVARLGSEVAGQPLALAEALVAWANAQGGKDNISAALARRS